jgi:hypothetical protein
MKKKIKKTCYICEKDVSDAYHRQIGDKFICDNACDYFFSNWKRTVHCLETYKKEMKK